MLDVRATNLKHNGYLIVCLDDSGHTDKIPQLISPGQNGRHFASEIFKYIFLTEKFVFSNFTEACS